MKFSTTKPNNLFPISVILGSSSGIHPLYDTKYVRIIKIKLKDNGRIKTN